MLTQNHTLLLPVLFSCLGRLPDVDFVHQAYDIPDEPDRVEKPGVAPVRPLKPEPPVHPGTFVRSDGDEDGDEDNENEKGLHDLAVEA